MGFFDKLAGELIDIIEWTDKEPNLLVHRFIRYENQIKMGAKLIVRPGQKAVFVREGHLADVFDTGTHTLTTSNMPVLSTLSGWKYGFNSPFKAEVYYIDTTEQLDRKWGTPNPVMLRDPDFGIVRLRCRGNFSYKIAEDKNLLTRFVGAGETFMADNVEGQIKTKIVSSFSDAIAEMKIPALDLAAKYDEISDFMNNKMQDEFNRLGLELLSFALENISLPEEVEKAMDERASIGVVGNMNQYSKFQSAKAMREAASNEGMAGSMMGMMVGGQMGKVAGNTSEAAQQVVVSCPKCKAHSPEGSKFCSSCGETMQVTSTNCVKCNELINEGSKFCSHCGAPQQAKCKKCKKDLAPTAKFCPECGSSQE